MGPTRAPPRDAPSRRQPSAARHRATAGCSGARAPSNAASARSNAPDPGRATSCARGRCATPCRGGRHRVEGAARALLPVRAAALLVGPQRCLELELLIPSCRSSSSSSPSFLRSTYLRNLGRPPSMNSVIQPTMAPQLERTRKSPRLPSLVPVVRKTSMNRLRQRVSSVSISPSVRMMRGARLDESPMRSAWSATPSTQMMRTGSTSAK